MKWRAACIDAFRWWKKWISETPEEKHSCVSFLAGWNAAMESVKSEKGDKE